MKTTPEPCRCGPPGAERLSLTKEECEALIRDASRWQALIGSARLRIMGSVGFLGPDYEHPDPNKSYHYFGLKVWSQHLEKGGDHARNLLTNYADRCIADKVSLPEGFERNDGNTDAIRGDDLIAYVLDRDRRKVLYGKARNLDWTVRGKGSDIAGWRKE